MEGDKLLLCLGEGKIKMSLENIFGYGKIHSSFIAISNRDFIHLEKKTFWTWLGNNFHFKGKDPC